MTEKQIRDLIKEKESKLRYCRDFIARQTSSLHGYLESNGPGYAFGVVVEELATQNSALIILNRELTNLKLDLDGLFAASGPGVQPARS